MDRGRQEQGHGCDLPFFHGGAIHFKNLLLIVNGAGDGDLFTIG